MKIGKQGRKAEVLLGLLHLACHQLEKIHHWAENEIEGQYRNLLYQLYQSMKIPLSI